MRKKNETNSQFVDNVSALRQKLSAVRQAQQQFSTYSQAQVDAIFHAAALAANRARLPLAKMAVEETGMGVVEDKVIKNSFAAEYIYHAYRNTKTCGVIEENVTYGTTRIAEPIGVVAAIIPTTNPTSTAIFKALICLKTRNAAFISPHPRAKRCTIAAAKIVLEAAVKAGAPEGIVAWIDEPSLEMTTTLMQEADIILATGGPGMVQAAYSSGKPALGVGAGNTPAVIEESADIRLAVSSIIHSKTFDNGMICASEQAVVVVDSIYDDVRREFEKRGCYILSPEETEQMRRTLFLDGKLNSKIVGQSAAKIAALAEVEVPAATKILIGEVHSTQADEAFAHEKLSPVLAMYRAADFLQAMQYAAELVQMGGYGHTAALYVDAVNEREKIDAFGAHLKACRIVVNTPASHGAIGDLYNFDFAPSLTLGCGSWGGNSVSENVGVKHLLNIKTVAERRENMLWFRTPQKVYLKRGCLDMALQEISEVLHRKRAFVVTDQFLFRSGAVASVTDSLQKMGIPYHIYADVQPDPTLLSAKHGAEVMQNFEPDVILAFGGGSAMDAAKVMWVLYEHPDADFDEMAMRFVDIRKRTYPFPEMGEKAYFIAIPTSSGTGSEVTPFAVITDETTGTKYPLADYALMPNMAIVDAERMMHQPKSLTAASGIDAMTHALEAYASVMATDYTDGLALEALRNIFAYLPVCYENGEHEPFAREKMANASTMAGMAFGNAFLGLCHSMAHKLGSFHHLPHGVANALLITHVMRYNAAEAPQKMGTFSQYAYPKTLSRYSTCGRLLGITGDTDEIVFAGLLEKIEKLKASVGIRRTIQEYGVEEKAFLETLDMMSEQAFDDQCTGANPRYPLISEIRALYCQAYYGDSR